MVIKNAHHDDWPALSHDAQLIGRVDVVTDTPVRKSLEFNWNSSTIRTRKIPVQSQALS